MSMTKYWKVKLRKSLGDMTPGDLKRAFQTLKGQSLLETSAPDNDPAPAKEAGQNGPLPSAASLPPAESVAKARERLKSEEKVFEDRKAAMKGQKHIGATKTKKEAEAQRQKEKAQEQKEKDWLHALKDYFTLSEDKEPKKETTNRIEKSLEEEKARKEIDKYTTKPLSAVELSGRLDYVSAKGIGQNLSASNTGDDIASASGLIAASATGVVMSLKQAAESYVDYKKTDGPLADQHLEECKYALGEAFGNLTNLSKGIILVTENSGALEATSAVPILGIVASIDALLRGMNDLRTSFGRLGKQRELRKGLKDDPRQLALDSTLKSFIARDKEAIGKGITKVILEFTKVAGHGVSLGGVSAPVGAGLTTGAAVAKMALSGVGAVEELFAANKANDARKKIDALPRNDKVLPGSLAGKVGEEKERHSRDLIQDDPRLASQVVIDQAVREVEQGVEGGAACKILETFGIKVEHIKGGVSKNGDAKGDDEAVINIKEMRQLMLYKLHAEDEEAQTLTQQMREARDGAGNYLSFPSRYRALEDYMKAKNKLEYRNKERDTRWKVKMVLIDTEDVEEKKAALLAQVEAVKDDMDAALYNEVKGLLKPREK